LLRRLDQALPRLVDLPSARFELLFEIGAGPASSTDPRLRSGRMKLATPRAALRPFARQGHLPRRRDQSASRSFGVETRSSSCEWRMFLSATGVHLDQIRGREHALPPGTRSSHFSYCRTVANFGNRNASPPCRLSQPGTGRRIAAAPSACQPCNHAFEASRQLDWRPLSSGRQIAGPSPCPVGFHLRSRTVRRHSQPGWR